MIEEPRRQRYGTAAARDNAGPDQYGQYGVREIGELIANAVRRGKGGYGADHRVGSSRIGRR
ncbi:MAG: hypothetical protein ACREFV_10505, partial [Acetobacteraceae bacterium]